MSRKQTKVSIHYNAPPSQRYWINGVLIAVVGAAVLFWYSSESSVSPSSSPTWNVSDDSDQWRQLRGYRVAGKNLRTSTAVSLPDCQALCASREDCAAFSWDGKCVLKSDIIPLEVAKSVTSGFKHITPSRKPSPPLFEMWGDSVWKEISGDRREAFSKAVSAVLDSMISFHESSPKSGISAELKKALMEHIDTLTKLQTGAGPAENAELLLLKAYVYMFATGKQSLSVLAEAESAAVDPVQKASAVKAKSYVLEGQGSLVEADRLRVSLLTVNHVFNHSYDDYLRLHLVGYAKGQAGPTEYGNTLLKLFAFRRFWTHEIQASGTGRAAWLKHFPATQNTTQGTPGVYLAGGGDLEAMQAARSQLFHNDFVVLRELLTPWEVKILTTYYKAVLKPFYENHDAHLGRTSAYNDRINYFLNSDFRPLMEQIFGFNVQVAYSFMCHYEFYNKDPGQPELKGHTDRQDNEWTISIQLYSEPEGLNWPILVDKELTLPPESSWRNLPTNKDRIVKAVMPPGDAILFMGRVHNHWRPAMPRNLKQFGSVLLHYVPTQFDRLKWNNHRGSSEPYE